MAVIDVANKVVTLKVVYYGCAMGGKTTNLVTLHKLTDPGAEQGLVSIATQDDRTLFFDLLPMELGRVGGMDVRVKLYTVPGQVHYETTRRQVLAGCDAVVLVMDSSPDRAQDNAWASKNMEENLKRNGLDPQTTPTIVQWNKRDLPGARPLEELEAGLNQRSLPSFEAVATTGAGVVETFATALKGSIAQAYKKAGKTNITDELIGKTVDEALQQARSRQPAIPTGQPSSSAAFTHTIDMEAYRDKWAEQGRDRRIMDQESLLAEAVQSGMELAEQLDSLKRVQAVNDRQAKLMEAMTWLAPRLVDPAIPAVPDQTMKSLLEYSSRVYGSILLFKPKTQTMEEREVHPGGPDVLNAAVAEGLGSAAFRFSKTGKPKMIEDLTIEVFFGAAPPGGESLASAYIVPLRCDGLAFGSLIAYAQISEPPIDDHERRYWDAAGTFLALSLHWRALRRKLKQEKAAAGA